MEPVDPPPAPGDHPEGEVSCQSFHPGGVGGGGGGTRQYLVSWQGTDPHLFFLTYLYEGRFIDVVDADM